MGCTAGTASRGKEEAAGGTLAVAEGNGSRRSLQVRRRSAAGGAEGNGALGFRLGGVAKKKKRGGRPSLKNSRLGYNENHNYYVAVGTNVEQCNCTLKNCRCILKE
ncbi:hypothetical protein LXL04_021476 [Taraxacum kok-saghyz]